MLPTGKPVELQVNGRTYTVTIDKIGGQHAEVTVNGRKYEVTMPAGQAPAPSPRAEIQPTPTATAAPRAPASVASGSRSTPAMMPGVVVSVQVAAGQSVERGQTLLILEAMKMENEIRADRSGTLAQVHVSAGQKVQTGDPLVTWG